ncbi:MAG: RNB domain-containing ribonuclease, partial [Candidatus Marinimicrobia bacterium]|nr:RNB domain-containing ribonuclease [Candidatus Neomarinimicrobiota bacterium]
MIKKIINILAKAPKNTLSQKELIKRLKVRKKDVGAVKILIRQISNSGEIVKLKANHYCLPNLPKKIEGKLSVTQKGFGFVITNDENEDIFIGRRSMADAINGDKVLVKIKGRSNSRGLSGRIHKVLERGSNTFIGVTYFYGGKIFIEISPVNPGRGIRLIGSKKELSEGKIVKARVKDWGNANNPIIASFESIIGNANDPANDLKMILHKYDYNQSFPSSINQEVNKYSEDDIKNEIKNRLDLRKEICFTIDPDEAKDFDDALSIKKNKMGTKIGVHIADVSHFVTPSSLIDKEAMNRGTSVYFTEGVVHMLPKELSADLCSIRPGVDRLAVSAIIQLNHNYKVLNVDIRPTVINSKARFTYQEVQNIIEGKNTHAFKAQINDLKKLSIALYKERSKNGSLDFDIPEPIFEMNDKGVPHEIRSSERLISHRIVEECMLLANKVVAVE